MNLVNANIKVPEGMIPYLDSQSTGMELLRNALILYPYIMNGTISNGKAAEILGLFKYELIEIYNSIGLPYISMDIKDVEWGREQQRLIRNRESISEIKELFKMTGVSDE